MWHTIFNVLFIAGLIVLAWGLKLYFTPIPKATPESMAIAEQEVKNLRRNFNPNSDEIAVWMVRLADEEAKARGEPDSWDYLPMTFGKIVIAVGGLLMLPVIVRWICTLSL